MTFHRNVERDVREAQEFPVLSQQHNWTGEQQREYDSLKREQRSLYDNLRTKFNYSHDWAFAVAMLEGIKDS